MFLKISQNSQKRNLCQAQVFSWKFCVIFKKPFFIEHLWWLLLTEWKLNTRNRRQSDFWTCYVCSVQLLHHLKFTSWSYIWDNCFFIRTCDAIYLFSAAEINEIVDNLEKEYHKEIIPIKNSKVYQRRIDNPVEHL